MKKIVFIFCLIITAAWQQLNAQCSTCTPVFTGCPPAGGLCNRLGTTYANHPYDRQTNFYMPHTITDPSVISQCSCPSVELRVIRVTGVSGLPTGVTYTLSQSGTYNVQNGDTVGCGHFCGTPLVAGTYPVVIYLEADVTAIGTPIGNVDQNNNPQQYLDTLWVLPDTTAGVSSFTYGNNGFVACDSLTIDLNALLSAPLPNLTRYFWNINGQTSQLKTPGVYTFTNHGTQPDTIPVTLTTVFYNYRVTDVHIDHINGGYCGDIEELTCSCLSGADSPDPYLKFPVLGFDNSSNYVSNTCTNVSFNNLNLSVPLGTSTLQLQIWDKDNGPPLGSQDDDIGNYTLNVGIGQVAFSDANASGHVDFDTVAGTTITETLNVIVNPFPALPTVVASADTFCSTDSVRLSAAPAYSNVVFDWYRDSTYLVGVADSAFYVNTAGAYKVKVTNSLTGCASTSAFDTIRSVIAPPSSISIIFNGTSAFVTPFPSSGFAVDWYVNGNLVPNQHGKFLPYQTDGAYTAELYNAVFPSCGVWAAADTIVQSGINELADNSVYGISIFPNPNSGQFTLKFVTNEAQTVQVNIQDVIGQILYSKKIENISGEYSEAIDAAEWSKGIYFVSVETAKGRKNEKVVLQ